MTVLALASLGGLISLISTSVGAVFARSATPRGFGNRFSLGIDFALGIMVSAAAFSLIGPVALEAASSQGLSSIIGAALAGVLLVIALKVGFGFSERQGGKSQGRLLLAGVLMLHNFPEGLASGAALAGLGWEASLPILGGISLQNIPEGALMVVCLRTMAWSDRNAFLGGVGSGVVEMAGGVLAGLLLQSVTGVLPLLLSFAGGAMISSVAIEVSDGAQPILNRLASSQFLLGLLSLPLLQYLTF